LRLVGKKLKVVVTGGEYSDKDLTISIEMVDGRPSICYTHYKTSRVIPAEWVSPKHPNPTRDNGLLLVIRGDHCGKYVRRVHHRYESEQPVIILAVVNRVEGSVDVLAEERLELSASDLCLGFETAEEKKWNDKIMTALRDRARKNRAK
jgi:hypothetical protein